MISSGGWSAGVWAEKSSGDYQQAGGRHGPGLVL